MPSPEPWIARVLLALSAGVGPIAAAAETPVAIVHLSGASIVPRWELQRAESDVVRAFERIDVDLADPLAFVLTHEIDHLLLRLHDIAEPQDGMTLPGEEHVRGVLDFARSWDRARPMVINCYAGISRSTASAYMIAAALAPELPHLRLDVPKPVPGLEVLRDGQGVDAALFGQSVPVDPGHHQLEARAPGHAPWQKTVSLEPRARLVVELPPLVPEADKTPALAKPAPAPSPEPRPAALVSTEASAEPKREGSNALAWTALGLGGAALVVGAIFGVRAISKSGDAQDRCR